MSNFKFKHALILLTVAVAIVWLTVGPQPVQTQLPTGAPSFPNLSAGGPQVIPRFYFRTDSLASITGAKGPIPGRQRILKTSGGVTPNYDTTEAFLTVGARIPTVLWQIVSQGTGGDSLNAALLLQVSNNPYPNKNTSWLTISRVGTTTGQDTFYTNSSITTEKMRYVTIQVPDTVSYYQAARFVVWSGAGDTTKYVIRPMIVYDDAGFMRTSRGNAGF